MTAVTFLQFHQCTFETLPSIQGPVPALLSLEVQRCGSLHSLPQGFCYLHELKTVLVAYCECLETIPIDLWSAPSLKRLLLSDCSSLVTLPLIWMLIRGTPPLSFLSSTYCSSLRSLPDNIDMLTQLEHLQLVGCASLSRLPESLGKLSELKVLDVQYCGLTALPYDMSGMDALTSLDASGCNSLKAVPRTLRIRQQQQQQLGLSYCSEVDSLAESLVQVSGMLADAGVRVGVRGWGEHAQGLKLDKQGTFVITEDAAKQLRRVVVVQRLLGDRGTVLELLSRLSWLGVLLGAATFTAALAAPGGFKQTLPTFFAFDLLSFGFSMMLVVFVVACSIPQTGWGPPKQQQASFGCRCCWPLCCSSWLSCVACWHCCLESGMCTTSQKGVTSQRAVSWCRACACRVCWRRVW